MPTWNAGQYLRFAGERTRPCRDLVAAISLDAPRRIIDLGCGPGNSTAVLAGRWPEADVVGLDSSDAMIAAARRDAPQRTFVAGDIAAWTSEAPFDLIFSNAALHWVPDHARTYPRLFSHVAPGGALAAQVPYNGASPAHEAMRAVAARPAFQHRFSGGVREWHVHPASFYYDVLAPRAARLDIWETEYLQVMPDAAAIVEWYKGTGLRPFLDLLPDEAERAAYLAEYLEAIRAAYPPQPDGRVLFPFRRLFVVAYQGG